MINERAMLRRFCVLQQFPDVPANIQSDYAKILILARRTDELARRYRGMREEMMSSARSLDSQLDQLWSPLEIDAARSRAMRR